MTSSNTPVATNSGTLPLGDTPRAQMYGLLLAGTMTGLPIPASIQFDNDGIAVFFDRNDRAAVDRWAAFFGLPAAKVYQREYANNDFVYRAAAYDHSAPNSFRHVNCEIDPTDAERAEVAR